ncbi:hypothetical protein [Aneurinibacillus danicus]|uniref:Uncharacterized protein n=1 Tax=Aneurinibacillus danicus TaxID=267746 RepID=A0A511V829_9BACL|nr:hypothetical protein [Aneurinibacillus danicus]GEN35105.1 hypothetical protein ADA01nite_25650 [Aneurinibacillus danicus]
MNQLSDLFTLQESMAILFDADAVDRRDWLERITPAELEWYYANGYIQ